MARISLGDERHLEEIATLAGQLMNDIQDRSRMQNMSYRDLGTLSIQMTFPRNSKDIIDALDSALGRGFKLTDEELDYIINYDIKYRIGITT